VKPPPFLPSHHQFSQRMALYDAYCVFQLDSKSRNIPIEIVEWMKSYTKIEDEYKGRQEEERASLREAEKTNKKRHKATARDRDLDLEVEEETDEDEDEGAGCSKGERKKRTKQRKRAKATK
jgi:hypothetical protein